MNERPECDESALLDVPGGAPCADPAAAARRRVELGAAAVDVVRLAIDCRDRGMPDASAQLLRELIDREPTVSAAYYELAFLHRLNGEHLPAAVLLARSLRRAGEDARTRLFLAHMLYAIGAHAEAEQTLDAASPAGEAEERDIVAMFELGAYLRAYPLGRALFLLEQIEGRGRYLTPHETAGAIGTALRAQAPFALVRLGDGEGAWTRLGASDEHAYRELYLRNRAEFCATWFGAEFPFRANGFQRIAQGLLPTIAACDVIGIPYASWVRHEYRICSVRGITSLVNIIRAFSEGDGATDRMLCAQHVHVDLHMDGLLEPILRDQRRIGVITCLEEVPALLTRRFGLAEVGLYRIPGERGSAALLGPEAVDGSHYPAVFERLQAELSQPHHGRLFLVAGGLLGKLYAETIRRHGGVALDIGSIVDAWTGRYTRPGYDSRLSI